LFTCVNFQFRKNEKPSALRVIRHVADKTLCWMSVRTGGGSRNFEKEGWGGAK